jgi:hypothetical protein
VVVIGIATGGVKILLGLSDGSTENATVAKELLSNLVGGPLSSPRGVLCAIDGAKALRQGDRACARSRVRPALHPPQAAQRCFTTLAERGRPAFKHRLRREWSEENHDRTLTQLQALAGELAHSHPGAAASGKEGMAETLTVTRLGINGALKRTLQSTNPFRVDDRDRQAHEPQRQALAITVQAPKPASTTSRPGTPDSMAAGLEPHTLTQASRGQKAHRAGLGVMSHPGVDGDFGRSRSPWNPGRLIGPLRSSRDVTSGPANAVRRVESRLLLLLARLLQWAVFLSGLLVALGAFALGLVPLAGFECFGELLGSGQRFAGDAGHGAGFFGGEGDRGHQHERQWLGWGGECVWVGGCRE